MAGIEVAGLALAVLPILATAAQQYNNCASPLKRYKRFTAEAQDYYQELGIQKAIFRDQCRNLLEEVVDHDAATSMLNSLTQTSWADRKLDAQIALLLGESLEACLAVIQLIEQRLQAITAESQRFKSVVDQEKQVSCCSFHI